MVVMLSPPVLSTKVVVTSQVQTWLPGKDIGMLADAAGPGAEPLALPPAEPVQVTRYSLTA